jgi:uncharacterized protein
MMDKPVQKNNGINIVYFTTQCNMACTYCYEELMNVKPKIMSKDELKEIAEKTIEREDDNNQTLFVLFGGEPTLQWDNVKFFMDYAYSLKKNVHFNMTSNGIKFLDDDFFNDYKENFFVKKQKISLDISFDGLSGNTQRIYHNGKQTVDDVIEVLKKFNEHNLPFRIRTTVNKDNLYNLIDEINYMKQFNPKRVILSMDWRGMEKEYSRQDIDKKLNEVKSFFVNEWMNGDITFPICEWFCEICDGCSITKSQIYDNIPNEGQKTRQRESTERFNTFNNLKKDT